MKSNKHFPVLMLGLALLTMSGMASAVQSANVDEMGTGVCSVVNLLTGKTLFGVAILAALGSGLALIFGAEMSDGLKKMATIVMVVGLVLSMSAIMKAAFSTFGAVMC